jgi:hypothetical protein
VKEGNLKIFSRTSGPEKLKLHESVRDGTNASLLKSWLAGVRWSHSRGNCFICVYVGILYKILFSNTTVPLKLILFVHMY